MLGLASLLIASQVNAATISLIPSATTVNVNDLFSLTVQGSGFGDGVTAGGVALSWDTSLVTLNSDVAAINSSLGSNAWSAVGITLDAAAGTLAVDAFAADFLFGISGPGFDFFSLDFTALPPPQNGTIDIMGSALGDWVDLNNASVSANYVGASVNIEAVPVPAAVWLFGSGLIGLVGVARRKQQLA